MSVKNAIESFTAIMSSLNTADQRTFLSFIADNWRPEEMKIRPLSERTILEEYKAQSAPLIKLQKIILDIKQRVPFDGILPSEQIITPTTGSNSDCNDKLTKHVDAFLYNDEELDELIEKGQIHTLYCGDCGSTNVEEYNIISHSLSVSALLHIFQNVSPSLEGKTLLDVGSRLGAVLYGAYMLTSAKTIIGVEMNKELCALQCDIVNKFGMNDRIEIVNKRIEACPDIVKKSDIIIMNNPFEFYVPESVHTEIWKFMRANTRSGTILVTKPSIEVILKGLKTGIQTNKWLKPWESMKNPEKPKMFPTFITQLDPVDCEDITFYEVV